MSISATRRYGSRAPPAGAWPPGDDASTDAPGMRGCLASMLSSWRRAERSDFTRSLPEYGTHPWWHELCMGWTDRVFLNNEGYHARYTCRHSLQQPAVPGESRYQQ